MEELTSLAELEINEATFMLTRASIDAKNGDVIGYGEVKAFLLMAHEALASKSRALESMRNDLKAAREETAFLEKELVGLMEERATLQQRMQQLQRESHHFLMEIDILRDQVENGPENVAPSPGSPSGVGRRLMLERARSSALEGQVAELTAQIQAMNRKESVKPVFAIVENAPGSPRGEAEGVPRKHSGNEEIPSLTFDDTTPAQSHMQPVRRRRSALQQNSFNQINQSK